MTERVSDDELAWEIDHWPDDHARCRMALELQQRATL